MSETIAVAIIAFLGTLVGTLGGIAAANKTVLFRLEQLERKWTSTTTSSSVCIRSKNGAKATHTE